MLPKWLWARTALGWATEVRFQGLAPAVSNRQLIANTVSLWSEIDEATGIKVPVFTLERDRVANWAQMLVGKGGIQSTGYVFTIPSPNQRAGSDEEIGCIAPKLETLLKIDDNKIGSGIWGRYFNTSWT